jgi:hypothetical protein
LTGGGESDQEFAWREGASDLADALAYFAELGGWRGVTLADVVRHINPRTDERFGLRCTCAATP